MHAVEVCVAFCEGMQDRPCVILAVPRFGTRHGGRIFSILLASRMECHAEKGWKAGNGSKRKESKNFPPRSEGVAQHCGKHTVIKVAARGVKVKVIVAVVAAAAICFGCRLVLVVSRTANTSSHQQYSTRRWAASFLGWGVWHQ